MDQHRLDSDIAKSLETNKTLLPYLPELLVDLWELGSSPAMYVNMLSGVLPPGRQTWVLDLGCGKGAVAVTLAERLGVSVVGIDGCQPFLEVARQKAREFGVGRHCEFRHGDIRQAVLEERDYDLVVLASIGSVLGGHAETVGQLRTTLKAGGYMLIDDGFLKEPDNLVRSGYEYCLPHGETIQQLTKHGDCLVEEILYSDEQTLQMNWGYYDLIVKRSCEVIDRHPDLEKEILAYIENQKEECQILDRYLTGAIWLLQKN